MLTYNQKDTNGKLMQKLWDVSHILRYNSGGRGSRKRILDILLQSEATSQAELTEHLGIQSGSASEILSKMEAAGLIRRTESEADRRTVNITLTETGKTEAKIAHEEREEKKADMFSVLSEEEKHTLLSTLEKLTEDWIKRYGEPGRKGKKQTEDWAEYCGEPGRKDKKLAEDCGKRCGEPGRKGRKQP